MFVTVALADLHKELKAHYSNIGQKQTVDGRRGMSVPTSEADVTPAAKVELRFANHLESREGRGRFGYPCKRLSFAIPKDRVSRYIWGTGVGSSNLPAPTILSSCWPN